MTYYEFSNQNMNGTLRGKSSYSLMEHEMTKENPKSRENLKKLEIQTT